MPGITGLIAKQGIGDTTGAKVLDQMLSCLSRESFYSAGQYNNDQMGIHVGWISHQGSFSDCMPVCNEDGTLVLIFSGEHFASSSVTSYLRSRGHSVEDDLDAKHLIHLYEEDETKFLSGLNGFFHGLIVDLRNRKTTLFNDRYGMHRLYCYESDDSFLFSSEAKAILRVVPQTRRVESSSLAEFLTCGSVLDNKTLYQGISLVPGGSAWVFENGTVRKRHYFSVKEWEQKPALGYEDFYGKLRATLSEVSPYYFRSRGNVGFSLTGGLDTRMILSSLDLTPGQVPCYTFAGLYGDSFDVKIAKAVADALQQPHYVLRLDRQFIESFPALLEKVVYVSDGYMDVSGVPNLYVNALARSISPIRLTGNYGQEVLRRYAAFRPMAPFKDLFNPQFVDQLNATWDTYREARKCHPLTFALFKQAPWYQFPRLSVEHSQLTLRSPLMDNAIVELVYQAPPEALTTDTISRRLIIDGNPRMGSILTDRGVDIRGDRVFSHVVRAYREFLFKMEYYFNHGMPQVLAKMDRIITPLQVEKLFLGQHKYYHLRTWLRNQWGSHVKDILLDPRTLDRPFINKKTLADIVNGHLSGTGNYTPQLSALLTIELLHRLFIERNWEIK